MIISANSEDSNELILKDSFEKSNALISAKYKSTLLENKLLAISLSKIKSADTISIKVGEGTTNVYVVEMTNSELVKLLGVNRHSLSTQLKKAASTMQSRTIGFTDNNGNFAFRNLIIGTDYINGVFRIYYNPLLQQFFKDFDKLTFYTSLSLETMMKLKSVHSFRLYELLKKECYTPKYKKVDNSQEYINYTVTFLIDELKLMLGVVNSELANVKAVLENAKYGVPDYAKAVSVSKEKGLERWVDFKKVCIDPAIKEINEKTDIYVSYEKEKNGTGGKVYAITFTIRERNKNWNGEKNTSAEFDNTELLKKVKELIEENITISEIKAICKTANNNYELIKNAYDISRQQKKIDNITAWLITAIKLEYSQPKSKKSSKSSNFNNFTERKYDYQLLFDEIKEN